jgi:hypothetical protein
MKVLDQLQSLDFFPYLNQTFYIRLDGVEPISLELVSVVEAGPSSGPGLEARLPFSLHFLGPVSPQYLLQHIYRLEQEEMGEFDLFLVPLGPESGRMRYEAIFS